MSSPSLTETASGGSSGRLRRARCASRWSLEDSSCSQVALVAHFGRQVTLLKFQVAHQKIFCAHCGDTCRSSALKERTEKFLVEQVVPKDASCDFENHLKASSVATSDHIDSLRCFLEISCVAEGFQGGNLCDLRAPSWTKSRSRDRLRAPLSSTSLTESASGGSSEPSRSPQKSSMRIQLEP